MKTIHLGFDSLLILDTRHLINLRPVRLSRIATHLERGNLETAQTCINRVSPNIHQRIPHCKLSHITTEEFGSVCIKYIMSFDYSLNHRVVKVKMSYATRGQFDVYPPKKHREHLNKQITINSFRACINASPICSACLFCFLREHVLIASYEYDNISTTAQHSQLLSHSSWNMIKSPRRRNTIPYKVMVMRII